MQQIANSATESIELGEVWGFSRLRAAMGGLAASVLAALTACGGDGAVQPPADPLQPYREQVVDWQPCDPQTIGGESTSYLNVKDRLSCATLRVPLDYADPGRGDAVVAVSRVAASERA